VGDPAASGVSSGRTGRRSSPQGCPGTSAGGDAVPAGPAPGTTIARVAELAGVSRATVSRVMNGRTSVGPQLVSRVLEAARALDYAPSPVARGLALGRTTTIALVVPDLANPMFQEILRGLGQAAGQQGHRLLVAETNEDVETEESLVIDARRRCDGIVLASSRLAAGKLEALVPSLAPVVLINRWVPDTRVPWLAVDYAFGIREIVAHLLDLGHRRFVYLAGPEVSVPNESRRLALEELSRRGRAFSLVDVECGSTFEAGHAGARHVIGTGATAVIAFNDMVALGALSGLDEHGVSVPDEISVTGFDDIPFARYTTPPLTTVSVPRNELGRQAWRRLWSLLRGEAAEHGVRFRPRLEVRGSTGPVRP
jgi:LacI family transcriptional regulator